MYGTASIVIDNMDGTITIGNTTIDICNLVFTYCVTAAAEDVSGLVVDVNTSTEVDASINDTKCNFGSTTTWVVTSSSSNISSITPIISNDGKFTIVVDDDQPWFFNYDIKCDNMTKDGAQVSGTVNVPLPVGDNLIPVTLDTDNKGVNSHFTQTSYGYLFDGNTTTATNFDEQRLHQGSFIEVPTTVLYPAGTSVEVYWTNSDYMDPTDAKWELQVGLWNNGTPTINETIYTFDGSTDTFTSPAPANLPTMAFDYILITALEDNSGDDPVFIEITLGNISNI